MQAEESAAPISPNVRISGIIERPPGELKDWSNNPRRHSPRQLSKLKVSIRQFGFISPIITDEHGVILKGHGSRQAAADLGLPLVPVRMVCGLTEAQKRAFVIADNKLSDESTWDHERLVDEIKLLIRDDFDIQLTAFSTSEVDLLFDAAVPPTPKGHADPGDIRPADLQVPSVSRVGDLWILGGHRLLCGNSLDQASYDLLMRGDRAQMVISDPPYNVRIQGHVCGSGKVKHREFAMASGEMSPLEFTAFLTQAFTLSAVHTMDGAICYYFMDWRHTREILDATLPVYGPPRQLCVWVKEQAGMGTFYRQQQELVWVFRKGDSPHINNFELGQHGRYRTNVWQYPGITAFTGKGHELLSLHPTVKPVALIADAIRDCSHRGGLILDPFAGSGTILVAAERTGRHARAIELDPAYVDVGIHRWERVTGKSAVLAATGQTWEQVRVERMPATTQEGTP